LRATLGNPRFFTECDPGRKRFGTDKNFGHNSTQRIGELLKANA